MHLDGMGPVCHEQVRSGYTAANVHAADAKPFSCADLCFKCFQRGHMARDCPNPTLPSSRLLCVRCGKASCAASGHADFARSMYGCSEQYASSDMQHVVCFVCGRRAGHCCCEPAPTVRLCCLHAFVLAQGCFNAVQRRALDFHRHRVILFRIVLCESVCCSSEDFVGQ